MIDKKQPNNVEYFKYFGSMMTNDARCLIEIEDCHGIQQEEVKLFIRKLD
jgi:hypothetical protein